MLRRAVAILAALGLLLAPAVDARRVPLRGVVEGYYGRPWSGAARRAVIRFLGGGTAVALSSGGSFDATVTADGGGTDVVVTTAAGEATARRVP